MLYLAMIDITKKWTGRGRDWGRIYAQLAVFFAERMPNPNPSRVIFLTGRRLDRLAAILQNFALFSTRKWSLHRTSLKSWHVKL
jgi:hypothetical protein